MSKQKAAVDSKHRVIPSRCVLGASVFLLALALASRASADEGRTQFRGSDAPRPNVVFIITDDMGYSDVGCYGGEIETPNIDSLARGGLKFSQFYNCGKCEPSRAALTTGHQFWTYDLTNDRTETRDLAGSNPMRLREMLALQRAFSQRPDVRLRLKPGEREPEYAAIYNDDGKIGPGARESVPDERASLSRVKQRAAGVQLNDTEASR